MICKKMPRRTGAFLAALLLGFSLVGAVYACINGGYVTTIAGVPGSNGHTDGTGSGALFYGPLGITVDGSGNLYVVDNISGYIRKVTPAGVVTTLAGGASSWRDGTGSSAGFFAAARIAIDASGNLYVSETAGDVRKVTPAGVVTTLVYGLGTGVFGIAVDASGTVYVGMGTQIKKISPSGVVSAFVGTSTAGYADGTGSSAQFSGISDIAMDSSGNLVVTDSNNQVVRRVTMAGVVTTVPGSSGALVNPMGITTDPLGNIYVTDMGGASIKVITPSGSAYTIAGGNGTGNTDGAGSVATFNNPMGIVSDSTGTLYVTNTGMSTIRKIQ